VYINASIIIIIISTTTTSSSVITYLQSVHTSNYNENFGIESIKSIKHF